MKGSETPYNWGYVKLVTTGAQRSPGGSGSDFMGTLEYLIKEQNAPVNLPDIAGLTALHHVVASFNVNPRVSLAILKLLLESGADPNLQNRYGTTPIFTAIMQKQLATVDLLMQYGADVEIEEADGRTPMVLLARAGPEVSAVVHKWLRNRAGQTAPLQDKNNCGQCGKEGATLQCSRCRTIRYCSKECQSKCRTINQLYWI